MDTPELLTHFNRLADAPGAIPRLRRLVLDLAVRGKLVAQDPGDEPASVLLERIAAETEVLIRRGEVKAPKASIPDEKAKLALTPPKHWKWCKLIDIAQVSYGFAFASDKFNQEKRGMPLIRIRDISKVDTEAYFEGDYQEAYIVNHGDYLVGMDGDFNLHRWRGRAALLNQRVMRINSSRGGVSAEFVKMPLQMVLDALHESTSQTTVKHLSARQVNQIEIPLPPLPEQHRIVAKVDELMGLLDQIEARQTAREATRRQLTTASLTRLSTSDTSLDDFRDHARFLLDHLPAHTNRRDQIKQLRQTILNLAVRGALVPQDPLERVFIQLERISRFDWLPPNWQTMRFGDHCDIEGGNQPPKSQFVDSPRPGYVRLLQIRDLGERPVPVYIPEKSTSRFCRNGEILIARYGASVGKIFWAKEGAYNVALAKFIWPDNSLIANFAFLVLCSNFFQSCLLGATRSAQAGFNKGDLSDIVFPVPPLAEQHRIVAKVNELMALCDHLDAALDRAEASRTRLLDAELHAALDDREPSELAA